MATDNEQHQRKKRKEIKTDERMLMFHMLLVESKDGKPKRGSFVEMARIFDVDRRVVASLWNNVYPKLEAHIAIHGPQSQIPFCLESKHFHNGAHNKRKRPQKWDRKEMKAAARTIPLSNRKTFHLMAW